jgi:hypothetical protein
MAPGTLPGRKGNHHDMVQNYFNFTHTTTTTTTSTTTTINEVKCYNTAMMLYSLSFWHLTLFICGLFNNTLHSSGYTASEGRMINEE